MSETLKDKLAKAEHQRDVLLAALERQVANIERWLETDEPADPVESKSIYDQMVAAIKKAKRA